MFPTDPPYRAKANGTEKFTLKEGCGMDFVESQYAPNQITPKTKAPDAVNSITKLLFLLFVIIINVFFSL